MNQIGSLLPHAEEAANARRRSILKACPISHIQGTAYYVSEQGDDANDGLTPDTAIRTLSRIASLELRPGDGVLFARGETFRGSLQASAGVTYGAFGEGKKPCLFGWDFSLADPSLWELFDDAHRIWRMTRPILDVGTLAFDGGARHSVKLIPSYIGGRFVSREDESVEFDMAREMVRDLDLYWHYDARMTQRPSRGEDFPVPVVDAESYGTLYLRCDGGNPGALFFELEALPRRNMISVGCDGVTVEGLCLFYIGCHAVGAYGHSVKGLTVRDCEIGWIGGCIQHYLGLDPNYPEGGRGTVTRYGNGVEIYGGCDGYVVADCYLHDIYDAGATHQVTTQGRPLSMKHIRYTGNLIERCVYGIEYFLDMTDGDTESIMEDVRMEDNIIRLSGCGWGQQRHNKTTPAHIKGWSYENRARDFVIVGNLFDRSAYRMLHLVAKEEESCPRLERNTYLQYRGGMLGQYGANAVSEPENLPFGEQAVREVFGDREAQIEIIE